MMKPTRQLSFVCIALVALLLLAAPLGWANDDHDDDDETPFDEAKIFFELNHTDGDLGIHALIDGEPWKRLKIEDHKEREILKVQVHGRLKRQGLTELFFESAEPGFDELSPEAFFRRFKEGTYEVEGLTLEGEELESEVELTHLMPAPPGNVMVSGIAAAADCDADDLPAVPDGDPVIISWEAVTHSHPDLGRKDEPIDVVQYQLVVEREEPTTLVFSVDLPPEVTELTIPAGFIALGDEFKYEILVREEGGNQTAIESCFEID